MRDIHPLRQSHVALDDSNDIFEPIRAQLPVPVRIISSRLRQVNSSASFVGQRPALLALLTSARSFS